jgi:hypothetical protein
MATLRRRFRLTIEGAANPASALDVHQGQYANAARDVVRC